MFIDRANPTDARSAMAGAADEIKNARQNVYMFPEGTRSYSKEPKLLPFKKGAFHLAIQAGAPIIPVVVANYSDVLYVQGYKFRSGTILCKGMFWTPFYEFLANEGTVLKPIETKNLHPSDVEDLTRDTREMMLQELVNLTARQRGQPIAMPADNGTNGVVKASGAEATLS